VLKRFREILDGEVEHALLLLWSGQLSGAEAAAIQDRVQGDPRYREEFQGSLQFLACMEGLAGDPEIQEMSEEYRRLLHQRKSKYRYTLGTLVGTIVAIGAAMTLFGSWSGSDDVRIEEHVTRIGEQKALELDDGSVVTLNTDSQLLVDYGGQVRRILLKRGEAHFKVAEDSERPFRVDLDVRSVTAIGTEFVIRKSLGHYRVAVIEGAVALHETEDEMPSSRPSDSLNDETEGIDLGRQQRVEAGWVAEFDAGRGRLHVYRPESMERFEGWRSGLLEFYQEPLHLVVQELNRYSLTSIRIEDSAVMDLSVFAALRVHDLETALIGLEGLLPIEITRHHDRIAITGRGKKAPAYGDGSEDSKEHTGGQGNEQHSRSSQDS